MHYALAQVEKWACIFTITVNAIVLVQTESILRVGAQTSDVGGNLQISSWPNEDSFAGVTR